MKKDVRIILIDTCGWIVTLSIIAFFFTLWLFSYNNIEEPLKEAWSISFSAISALATIGAAFIAVKLYDTWKEQALYATNKEHADAILSVLSPLKYDLIEKLETLYGLKQVKEFAVLKDNFKNYDSNLDKNFKMEFYKNGSHMVYFKSTELSNVDNPIEFFADLERHHSYISMFFSEIMFTYSKYYDHLIQKIPTPRLTYNRNLANKNYNMLNIDPNFYHKDKILLLLDFNVGFHVRENETMPYELIEYANLEKMILATIRKVEILEHSMIEVTKRFN